MLPRRSTTIAVALVLCAAALLIPLGGCDPKTQSPFSGKPVTGAQLQAEASAWVAEQDLAEQRAQAEAQTQLRAKRTAAAIEAKRLVSQGDLAMTELQARLEAEVQDIVERVQAEARQRETAAASMQERVDLAQQELKRQSEQRLAGWGVLKALPYVSTVASLPGVDNLVTTLISGGVGAGVIQLTKRPLKRRKDELEEELDETAQQRDKAATELATTHDAARRIVDSIDFLAGVAPEVGDALVKWKAHIDQWQGLIGKELVDRLQRGEKPKSLAS